MARGLSALGLMSTISTQLYAFLQHYHPALGTPLAQVGLYQLYPPLAIWQWAYWWGQQQPQPFAWPALVFVAGTGGLLLLTRQTPEEHAPVRWATRRSLTQAGLFARHGVVLGTWHRKTLRDDSETHVLMVAPSGSQKTQTMGIPTALTWLYSLVLHDPKNELYPASAGWRSQFSTVIRLDPTDPTSDCYDPL